ncbi:MAG: N-acetylmuramoyl-L-alanine amidase [Lachnospira sp.]|jgi:N-acetylmuramoyl-L-alanine amidase|nr:N-acetylmuramoyl-L-alanine amidase [Lachnospira sp.]
MADYRIALDAGHGGSDPGAVYKGRQEKEDTLDLTLAVGDILKKNGIDVYYTRTTDEYETPFKKATDANNSGADLFVSIHRNSSENPNQYSGVETLVYSDTGLKAEVARNINNQLEDAGFKNLGVDERKNLVVLKRTKMPAVLVEAGFINNDKDNYLFDEEFDSIAQAIADGILESIPSGRPGNTTSNKSNRTDNNNNSNNNSNNNNSSNSQMNNSGRTASAPIDSTAMVNSIPPDNEVFSVPVSSSNIMPQCPCDNNDYDTENEALYRVQVGAYRNKDNADRMLNSLLMDGFPAFIIYEDGYYKVQVGAYRILLNAIKMEQRLRRFRYSTYIVYS